MKTSQPLEKLLWLSHQLGEEARGLTILGEGNTSTHVDAKTFYVKASGSTLGSLEPHQVTLCKKQFLLDLLTVDKMGDLEIDEMLLKSRVNESALKPSVEAIFHAYLLSLPGVGFVGHTHATHVNQLLCSGKGKIFSEKRLFPDHIVCCGARSVLIPYTDPGLTLAKVIKKNVDRYVEMCGTFPRTIHIENHGLICLGKTEHEVLSGTLMSEKAAKIMIGAFTVSPKGPVYLSEKNVRRIDGRPDEHYRQKMLARA